MMNYFWFLRNFIHPICLVWSFSPMLHSPDSANGVKNEEFFILDDVRIFGILKDETQHTILNFISKYNFHKGLLMNNVGNKVLEVMNVVNQDDLEQRDLNSRLDRDEFVVEEMIEIQDDVFTYKENKLYHLLNSTLRGRIILGQYKASKTLDSYRLKDIVILDKLENSENYKIDAGEFIILKEQIGELFPSEIPNLFYEAYKSTKKGKVVVNARGSLYSHYTFLRRLLREAEIFFDKVDENTAEEESSFADENIGCSSICDKERDRHSTETVIRVWNSSFHEREKILTDDKKVDAIEKYFKSFPCLTPPFGIALLESDFDKISEKFLELTPNGKDEELPQYSSLFRNTWPKLSEKIISHCENLRLTEVKQLLNKYKDLIEKVPKIYKGSDPDSKSEFISKTEISKCFILHVKELSDLESEKARDEKFLRDHDQPLLPYVIICGKIESSYETHVIINSEKYWKDSPEEAVEACFKCLTALRKWPQYCDYVWDFIHRFVYGLEPHKSFAAVSKVIDALKKPLKKPMKKSGKKQV